MQLGEGEEREGKAVEWTRGEGEGRGFQGKGEGWKGPPCVCLHFPQNRLWSLVLLLLVISLCMHTCVCLQTAQYFIECVTERDISEVDLELIRGVIYKVLYHSSSYARTLKYSPLEYTGLRILKNRIRL